MALSISGQKTFLHDSTPTAVLQRKPCNSCQMSPTKMGSEAANPRAFHNPTAHGNSSLLHESNPTHAEK